MLRQSGVAAAAIVAGLAVLAAVGAGVFAWSTAEEVERVRGELAAARQEADKSRTEARKAAQDLASAAKQAADMKVALDRLTLERDAVRTTMENAQASGVQLRTELDLAKEQVSYLSARASKDVVRGMPRQPGAK
jgi:uncharacterized protein (DUF3084 family)